MFGQGFKTTGALLIALGTVVAVFGLLPGGRFHIRLPGLHREAKKTVPSWLGRVWFLAIGALLIYLGVRR